MEELYTKEAIGQLTASEFSTVTGRNDDGEVKEHLRQCLLAKSAVMSGLFIRASEGDNTAAKQYLDNSLQLED
jgi:hypothetical protein